jgi:superfamily I DNA and RNA helicase
MIISKYYAALTLTLLVLGFLAFLAIRKIIKRHKIRKRLLEDGETDINETAKNIAQSISKARGLYKTLIVTVHPDRFEERYREEANELAARITRSKRNYLALIGIKKEVDVFIAKSRGEEKGD